VLCVDEKPSIQALERAQGYLKLPNGRALTGQSHDYKRHGTTTLFAAQRYFLLGLIEPTGALHEPRLRCLGILHGPILCLGILLGCSCIFHNLCSLHGPDLSLLLHRPDLFWGSLHDLCLYGLYGSDLEMVIVPLSYSFKWSSISA
jgi:hypothetical protein